MDPPVPLTASRFAESFGATASQVSDLETLRERLAEANRVMNLVGPGTLADYWSRHVLDSAQLFHVEQQAKVWADVGAGAGFPGVVLAILLKDVPGARVHLIESRAKRARFLDAICGALTLPVVIHHARSETTSAPSGLEVVTARACAPLPRLFDFTAHFFAAGARGLFLKGRDVESELTEARRRWTFQARSIPSQSDSAGRLLRIEGLLRRA